MTTLSRRPVMDPDAVLDWAFDWNPWLADGETIDSHQIDATGITVDSHSETGGIVTAWLSGGTARTTAYVTCRITTNQGRTDDRTINIYITNR